MYNFFSPKFRGFFFFVLFHSVLWSQSIEEIKISASFVHLPVLSALNYLETHYPVRIFYKTEWFQSDTIHKTFTDRSFPETIELILQGKFTYKILNGTNAIILPKNEVLMITGQIENFSNKHISDDRFLIIGDLSEAGKHKTVSVSGQIIDGKTRQPVIGATIQLENIQQGVVTNSEGYYKLLLTPGLYTFIVSSVGYEKSTVNIKIVSNGELKIELFDKSVTLDDIVIYGQKLDKNVSNHQMSMVELSMQSLNQLPSVSGGKDVLKGLTVMPGVKSIGEFSSGINVRGGGEDQNLYLINGSPLFSTSHVFGLYSVINPDMVERLTLYKGHIPSGFGERVSSVVEIRTKETGVEKFGMKGGIGLYDSHIAAEIPVIKEKVFINLGGRTSYSDWLLKKMKDPDLKNSRASFYDLTGALHANIGKSRISVSGYSSYDQFRFASDVNYHYGSILASFNWNYLFNSVLSSSLSLAYSEYEVQKENIRTEIMKSKTESGIKYKSLKFRMKYGGIRNHNIDAGINLVKYNLQPGIQKPLDELSLVVHDSLETEQGYEAAVFVNDEITINKNLVINLGLRYSAYANIGSGSVAQYTPETAINASSIEGFTYYDNNEIIKIYHGFEPRVSARLNLSQESSLKISYNRNIQYISLISYSSVSMPDDIWKLADPFIKPLIANQYAMGYYRNFINNTIETSLEVYYKGLLNVIDYIDGPELTMNNNIETQLVNATGRNYGVEVLLKKNMGTIDGWITYTFSRSLRRTNGEFKKDIINSNNYYPSSYDRPHDFGVVANYHLNRRIMFSANFNYSSGRPVTLPEYKYYSDRDVVVYFSKKNKYRIPAYNRLDLNITIEPSLRVKKTWKGKWTFSVLNVYGRKNAYSVYYKKREENAIGGEPFSMYKLYLIGRPVPIVTYSFMF